MQRFRRLVGILGAVVVVITAGALSIPAGMLPGHSELSVIRGYCVRCHNAGDLAGGVSFERLRAATGRAGSRDNRPSAEVAAIIERAIN